MELGAHSSIYIMFWSWDKTWNSKYPIRSYGSQNTLDSIVNVSCMLNFVLYYDTCLWYVRMSKCWSVVHYKKMLWDVLSLCSTNVSFRILLLLSIEDTRRFEKTKIVTEFLATTVLRLFLIMQSRFVIGLKNNFAILCKLTYSNFPLTYVLAAWFWFSHKLVGDQWICMLAC